MDTKSPLQELVVDTDTFDQERLANVLRGRIALDADEGAIRFSPGTKRDATILQGCVMVLLGQEALHILDQSQNRGLKPKEVATILNAKGNSVRPKLKDLVDDGIAVRGEDGRYTVPPYAFDDAAEVLEGGTS